MTSRAQWQETAIFNRRHKLTALTPDAAAQIARDMAAHHGDPAWLEGREVELAGAARLHPRPIERAVAWLNEYPISWVLTPLRTLRDGEDIEALMHDILYRTLAQIETLPNGVGAVADLKRLLVCRGGFTLEAAEALLGESALASLSLLRRWTLLRLESERYAPDVLVEAALTPDASAHAAHHIFCLALARAHDQRQDYAGLNIESDNLTAAFEWAMDAGEGEKALALLNATGHFLLNRGRAREFATQAQRVSAALAEHPDKQVWANAQNTLGNAYSDLAAVEERAANLKRAVECYQRALEHYTPDAASLGYAATQDNLGLAYKKLKDKDKARAAFQEAEHYFRQMGDVDNAEKAWAQQRVFN